MPYNEAETRYHLIDPITSCVSKLTTNWGAPSRKAASEDGYLAACEIVRLKPSIDWKTFTRAEVLAAKPIDARTGKPVVEDDLQATYRAQSFDDRLIIPDRIAAMCADLFARLCENGGPEQKVIIFCNRDLAQAFENL